MLKINHHHKEFHMPQFGFSQPLHLSPVPVDSDELSQAIEHDPIDHDNNWVLSPRPDQSEIDESNALWDTIVEDVRSDPEWFKEDES